MSIPGDPVEAVQAAVEAGTAAAIEQHEAEQEREAEIASAAGAASVAIDEVGALRQELGSVYARIGEVEEANTTWRAQTEQSQQTILAELRASQEAISEKLSALTMPPASPAPAASAAVVVETPAEAVEENAARSDENAQQSNPGKRTPLRDRIRRNRR